MKRGGTDGFAAHGNSNDYTERALIAIAGRAARHKETQSIRFGARMQNVWRFLVQHPGAGWRFAPRFLVLSQTMQLVVSDDAEGNFQMQKCPSAVIWEPKIRTGKLPVL